MADDIKLVEGKYLMYQDKPLVREGNTICYGDKTDRCMLILEIMSYKKVGNNEVPDQVFIQVVESNNPNNIVKQGDKPGLNNALALGMVWLEKANKQ